MAPKWPPKLPKNGQKTGPKNVPQNVKAKLILGPNFFPKIGYLGDQEAQSQEAGAILKALVSKMAPRWLKTSPNSPRWLLGSLLGPSEAVLEGLGTPETLKKQWLVQGTKGSFYDAG